jgi:superfamily II DNA/RNA helicase
MELKKINPNLKQALFENGLTEANELQAETFSTIKSGADAVIQSGEGSGKTTTLVINIIQKLDKAMGESPRALVLVENKDKVIEMATLFRKLGNYMDLRVFGVHEKGDTDFDKNHISLGLDVLIGTPDKINQLFSTAGFNLNTIKIFAVDDADKLFKNRMDAVVQRLSMSIEKTQRLFFTTDITEKVEILAEKVMIEPFWFEMDEEE